MELWYLGLVRAVEDSVSFVPLTNFLRFYNSFFFVISFPL